jgi:hypothetical protein
MTTSGALAVGLIQSGLEFYPLNQNDIERQNDI